MLRRVLNTPFNDLVKPQRRIPQDGFRPGLLLGQRVCGRNGQSDPGGRKIGRQGNEHANSEVRGGRITVESAYNIFFSPLVRLQVWFDQLVPAPKVICLIFGKMPTNFSLSPGPGTEPLSPSVSSMPFSNRHWKVISRSRKGEWVKAIILRRRATPGFSVCAWKIGPRNL